jgi:hypothetical protein
MEIYSSGLALTETSSAENMPELFCHKKIEFTISGPVLISVLQISKSPRFTLLCITKSY